MIVDIVLFALIAVVAPPVLLLALEIFRGLAAAKDAHFGHAPNFVILMPAHDEAAVISATLANIMPQLRTGDRLLVIADNCTDATADIAAAHGAQVTVRNDCNLRGKGYALAHGATYAAQWSMPITIIVDADCFVTPGSLEWLAADAWAAQRPVQGAYSLTAPEHASVATRFSAFAVRVKNIVRLSGSMRSGIPCVLTGSGLALPTDALNKVELGSGEIVEDLLLSIDLAVAGMPARFCPYAVITSPLPTSQAAMETQRTRWEGGYMSIMRRYVPNLLAASMRRRRSDLAWFALDLAIPPLSLLALAVIGMMVVTTGWALLGGGRLPMILAACQAGLFFFTIAIAWHRHGRDLLSLAELLALPLAILRKIAFYGRMARAPQSGWVRTGRDPGEDGALK